jgi:hypothetical protein
MAFVARGELHTLSYICIETHHLSRNEPVHLTTEKRRACPTISPLHFQLQSNRSLFKEHRVAKAVSKTPARSQKDLPLAVAVARLDPTTRVDASSDPYRTPIVPCLPTSCRLLGKPLERAEYEPWPTREDNPARIE